MRRARAYLLVVLPVLLLAGPTHAQTITDAIYNAHHPRLLITRAELPALQAKLTDGGVDDALYVTVRQTVLDTYPHMTTTDILGLWFGEQSIPCIGLVALLENDTAAQALGRTLTLYLVDTYEPDYDEAASGMRLRALAIGYDMCFQSATPADRGRVRDEIVRYIQKMVWTPAYERFEAQPYLGNHSAMFGAALGLASIALQGETESYLVTDGIAMTDRIVENLLRYEFDPNGAYNEGAFYAAWTLKQLVYYFDARHRFDGRSYTDNAQFRAIEGWFAYELSPEGSGRSFNLNDSPLLAAPLGQHPTFFNWATSAWSSGLAAWLWNHTAGGLGANLGATTDWTGTLLWNKSVPAVEPGTLLPHSRVWSQRGLFYYRSGWPSGATSNDVVFSFYSGKFQGGHAQEDQNQFALRAYGTAFVIDHGAGTTAKESEAHNMVFIDGKGQHNAGNSIGTDGVITDYVLGAFADVVSGDATAAYGTYSEFNAPDYPTPGTDWSWGYSGANPVLYARRTVLCVHGMSTPFYAVVMDDIDKDGTTHSYEWRLHTANTNTVDITTNPFSIDGADASMDVHLLSPAFSSVNVVTEPFNAGNTDPNSTLLRVTTSSVNPKFSFLLMPRASGTAAPVVSRYSAWWGCAATIDWGNGVSDVVIRNDSGAKRTYAGVRTNAAVTVVRRTSTAVDGYLMEKGSSLIINGTTMVTFYNGPANCQFASATVQLDRYDADFRIRDTGVSRVLYRDQDVGFAVDNGYVIPDGVTSVPTPARGGALSVHAWPNPFNPATTISIEGAGRERVRITIYDVAGRRVRDLWNGMLPDGRTLAWNGRDDTGARVSSGTYFVRVTTPSGSRAVKLTVLK